MFVCRPVCTALWPDVTLNIHVTFVLTYTKHTYQAKPHNFCFNEVLFAKLLAFLSHLRRLSVNRTSWSFCRPEVRSFDLVPFFTKKGGSEELFPVRFFNVTFQFIELLQNSLLICDVSPFSDQVFCRFFRMDNLRGYVEDETSSSSCLGPSSKELPSPSAGTAPPLGTQAAVMAGTPSSAVPVTSGPVPPVSARSGSSLPGSQDCVTPSSGNQDDLLPPPPPAEPYEDFLARVGRDLSDSSRSATQPTSAARPCASVTTTTTGNRLPPFPTYEDSSGTLQNQV